MVSFSLGARYRITTTTTGSVLQTIAEILNAQPEVKYCHEYHIFRGLGREIKHGKETSFRSDRKMDKLKKVEHKILAVLSQRTCRSIYRMQ